MNKNNIKNIEFINSDLIARLNMISNEYSVSFDTLVNIAVLKFIDDISLLRLVKGGKLDVATLSEQVLSLQRQ